MNHRVAGHEKVDILSQLKLSVGHIGPHLIVLVGALLAPFGVSIQFGEQPRMGLEGNLHKLLVTLCQVEHEVCYPKKVAPGQLAELVIE